jgi:hypothetical protein
LAVVLVRLVLVVVCTTTQQLRLLAAPRVTHKLVYKLLLRWNKLLLTLLCGLAKWSTLLRLQLLLRKL